MAYVFPPPIIHIPPFTVPQADWAAAVASSVESTVATTISETVTTTQETLDTAKESAQAWFGAFAEREAQAIIDANAESLAFIADDIDSKWANLTKVTAEANAGIIESIGNLMGEAVGNVINLTADIAKWGLEVAEPIVAALGEMAGTFASAFWEGLTERL